MQICKVLNFFCISAHASNACISQIHATYAVNFLTVTSTGLIIWVVLATQFFKSSITCQISFLCLWRLFLNKVYLLICNCMRSGACRHFHRSLGGCKGLIHCCRKDTFNTLRRAFFIILSLDGGSGQHTEESGNVMRVPLWDIELSGTGFVRVNSITYLSRFLL